MPSSSTSIVQSKTQQEVSWREQYIYVSHIIAVIVSAVLVLIISLETFTNSQFLAETIYFKLEFGICIYFMLDIIFLWYISDDKWKIIRGYSVIFLLSIPYLAIINSLSLSLPNEVLYLIRFIPLVRGGIALAFFVFMTVKSNVSGLLISYILLLSAMTYFLSLTFYVFELHTNPEVENYGDVVWWAAMTVTTVGSSILPLSVIGKISTTMLAAVGMMIFPIFTVYITSVVQRMNKKTK